jgi:hypothetical protein
MRISVDWKGFLFAFGVAGFAAGKAMCVGSTSPYNIGLVFLVAFSIFFWPVIKDFLTTVLWVPQRRPARSRMIPSSSRHSGSSLPHLPPA